jgi:hypothetical protein
MTWGEAKGEHHVHTPAPRLLWPLATRCRRDGEGLLRGVEAAEEALVSR